MQLIKNIVFRIFEKLSSLLETHEGRNFYITILKYLFNASNLEEEYITKSFHKISNVGGNIAMTTAERLIEKGMEKGMEKTKKDTALRMIRQNFNNEMIEKITGLSQEEIEKLRKE